MKGIADRGGRGMKNTVSFVGFSLVVVLFLVYLSTARSSVPAVPDDFFHRGVMNNNACTTCHTPGMQAPLKNLIRPRKNA